MFDARDEGLEDFQKNLEFLVSDMPTEAKSVLRKVGTKARTIAARVGRKTIKKKTGNYNKSWKRGKVWQEEEGAYKIRIYNNAPHAHLLEDGHRIVRNGQEVGFAKGFKVMDKANNEIEKVWDELLETEIDKLMDKL